MRKIISIILAAAMLTLCGCSCNSCSNEELPVVSEGDTAEVSQSDAIEYSYYGGAPGTPLTSADLDIFYNGKIINGDMSAAELEQALGIELAAKGENIKCLNYMVSSDYECDCFFYYYPSMQNQKMEIEYWINHALGETRIIGIEINKGSVGRGISIGDTVEDIVAVYGEPIEPGHYRYYSNSENYSYSIDFFVNRQTNKITYAYILYGFIDIEKEWNLHQYVD